MALLVFRIGLNWGPRTTTKSDSRIQHSETGGLTAEIGEITLLNLNQTQSILRY